MRPFEQSQVRRRRRELAGDARAGLWARGRARVQQRAFLRENLGRLAVLVLIGLVICVGIAWTMPTDLLRGVVIGAFLVAVPGAIWMIAVQLTGTAPVMMGDGAEQWTASDLRPLTRDGWHLVNHLALSTDDIDHVLIGPGGAYAFETKWSSSWDSTHGRQRLLEAVEQARTNARKLGLWSPMKQLGVAPVPVVVLWGLHVSKWDDHQREQVIAGVTVLAGPELRAWCGRLGRGVLSAEQVLNAWQALAEHAQRRDQSDAVQHPVPVSFAEWVSRGALSVGGAALGCVAVGQLQTYTRSIALSSTLACALLIPALTLRHSLRWRWLGWSWIGGVALTTAALLAAGLITAVT